MYVVKLIAKIIIIATTFTFFFYIEQKVLREGSCCAADNRFVFMKIYKLFLSSDLYNTPHRLAIYQHDERSMCVLTIFAIMSDY